MLIGIGIVIILAVTAATAFFVAQEFAYVAVDRARLKSLADDGDSAAGRALKVCSRLSFMLSGAQLGITVTALFAGLLAEPYLGEGLAAALGGAGVNEAVSTGIAVVLALLFANAVQMVVGELAPKNLAIAKTVELSRWLARPTLVYLAVAGPLIRFFDSASNRLLRAVGIDPVEELPHGASTEELHGIIGASRESGHLEPELSRLLDRGLSFRELSAGQVMTPRVAVDTVPATATVAEVVARLDGGRARFPVIGDGVDDVVGIVGISELITVPRDRRHAVRVREIATEPLLIPESLRLPEVLERLRAEHRQLACVVDEYGGLAGIVTFEDVAEEIVGDIRDERDLSELNAVRRLDGGWLLPGRWRIDEIADRTGVHLPLHEDYETVSGLIMDRLGRVPRAGDTVDVAIESGPDEPERTALLEVVAVQRHVPATVVMRTPDVEVSA